MNKFKNAVAIKQINIQEEADRFLIGSMVIKAAGDISYLEEYLLKILKRRRTWRQGAFAA